MVLRQSKKLKNTCHSISEGFSERERQKHYWQHAKVKRQNPGKGVLLCYDKFIIHGQAYTWDDNVKDACWNRVTRLVGKRGHEQTTK